MHTDKTKPEDAVHQSTLATDTNNTSVAQPATAVPDNTAHDTRETVIEDQDIVTGTAHEEATVEDEAFVIDHNLVAMLFAMFTAATRSFFYMSNPKRVKLLKEALVIPVSDDKSFQQFYNHAEKDLLADAYRKAREIGGTPTEVTSALIMEEAHSRYFAKHQKRAIVNEEYEG